MHYKYLNKESCILTCPSVGEYFTFATYCISVRENIFPVVTEQS